MAKYQTVFVPDLGKLSKATVAELLVQPGEAVTPDQPVTTLETDKAIVEIPSPIQGYVGAIHVQAGQTVSSGDALVRINKKSDGSRQYKDGSVMSGEKGRKPNRSNTSLYEDGENRPPYIGINKYQRIALVFVTGLAILAILFPPFVDVNRGYRFAGYYPLFSVPDNLYISIHIGFLAIEVAVILLIGLILYIVLKGVGEQTTAGIHDKQSKNKDSVVDITNIVGDSLKKVWNVSKGTLIFIGKWWWIALLLAVLLRLMKFQ